MNSDPLLFQDCSVPMKAYPSHEVIPNPPLTGVRSFTGGSDTTPRATLRRSLERVPGNYRTSRSTPESDITDIGGVHSPDLPFQLISSV